MVLSISQRINGLMMSGSPGYVNNAGGGHPPKLGVRTARGDEFLVPLGPSGETCIRFTYRYPIRLLSIFFGSSHVGIPNHLESLGDLFFGDS